MEKKGNIFKYLLIMFAALIVGLVLFTLVSLLVVLVITGGVGLSADPAFAKVLQVLIPLVAVVSVSSAFTFFNKRIQAIPMEDKVAVRIEAYRAAAILRWALIEFPALLSIIGFLMTGSYTCLVLAVALMLVFATTFPSKSKIVQQLQLDDNELLQLENGS